MQTAEEALENELKQVTLADTIEEIQQLDQAT